MTPKQLAILNSMVTYMAENMQGDMSEEEHEVARIVARWALTGTRESTGTKEYDYKVINPTHFRNTEDAVNSWAERGWRVVGTTPGDITGSPSGLVRGFSPTRILYGVILERPVGVSHPDD